MKKIVAIVLSFAMMIGMAAICTFAAEDGYSVDGVVATPVGGKTSLTLSVTAPADALLAGITVRVSFNTEKLTLVEKESENDYFVDTLFKSQINMVDIQDGKIALMPFAIPTSESDVFAGGTATLAKIEFDVAEGAKLEDADITFEVTDATDFNSNTIYEKFGTTMVFETPDTTALEAAIAKAEALNAEEYTEDSFAAVTTALEAAKAALEGTQDEINAAAAALEDAISKLVKVETPDPEDPDPENPTPENPDTEDPDEETPPTADVNVFAYVSVAVIAMAAVAFVVSKRKKA